MEADVDGLIESFPKIAQKDLIKRLGLFFGHLGGERFYFMIFDRGAISC
jgi:hypothetical protein